MHPQSKKFSLTKKDCKNLLVEKWMQRNSKNNFTIAQTYAKPNNTSITKSLPSYNAKPNKSKNNHQPHLRDPLEIKKISNKKISRPSNLKRSYGFVANQVEDPLSFKIVKQTKTVTVIKAPGNNNSPKKIECESSKNVLTNLSAIKSEEVEDVKPDIIVINPSNQLKIKNLSSLKSSNKSANVFKSLLKNYQDLKILKSWASTQYRNSSGDECVIFLQTFLINKSNTPVPVIKKSLLIDEKSKINYSVHGLPVNTFGTILPNFLDDINKLVSVLHVFDKMHVCDGIGMSSDISMHKNTYLTKDNCGYWRHKNCKIMLVKCSQCSICQSAKAIFLD